MYVTIQIKYKNYFPEEHLSSGLVRVDVDSVLCQSDKDHIDPTKRNRETGDHNRRSVIAFRWEKQSDT